PTRRRHRRPPAAPRPRVAGPPSGEELAPASAWARHRAQPRSIPRLPVLVRAARHVGRAALAVPLELAFLARSYRNLPGTVLLLVAGSQQLNDYWGGPWGFPFTLFKWSLLARATGTKVAVLSPGA